MRILIHTLFYAPDLTGVAKYTSEMCEWLAAHGHEVEVVAPPPHYPQWQVQAPYRQWRYGAETLRGVRLHRCPVWIPHKPGGLARVFYTLSFFLSSLPVMLHAAARGHPDVILSIEPPLLGAVGAWLAARLAGAMAWLHIQDFEIDLAYGLRQLRRGRRCAAALESWVLRHCDAISSITPRLLDKARRKGADPGRLFLLPNWFDPSAIYPSRSPSSVRRELAVEEGALLFLFSGSLGDKQGLDVIVETARETSSGAVFLICGEGVALPRLKEVCSSVPNVRFLPLQPAARLNELLNAADVHLLPQDPCAAGSVMPSKLIGMLASGRPVLAVAAAGSEIAELVDNCGLRVEPGDATGLARAVAWFIGHPGERLHLGKNARRRALERFSAHEVLPALQHELLTRAGARGRACLDSLAPG